MFLKTVLRSLGSRSLQITRTRVTVTSPFEVPLETSFEVSTKLNGVLSSEWLFHDFKYQLQRERMELINDERFAVAAEAEKRPLVLLFGWAGASHKNLGKYAEIYQQAGCATLAYILPTRFIFECTEQVPFVINRLFNIIEENELQRRPVFIHNLSDTAAMCNQGLEFVMPHRFNLDIRGAVLDSSPSKRPTLNGRSFFGLMIVNWICAKRDGQSTAEATQSLIRFLERVRVFIPRWRQGLPAEMSLIDGIWAGDFVLNDKRLHPELFLYSKSDFYLSYKYIEETVLPKHRASGRLVKTVRWGKSPHVGHLKKHKKQYSNAVWDFIDLVYFKDLRKS